MEGDFCLMSFSQGCKRVGSGLGPPVNEKVDPELVSWFRTGTVNETMNRNRNRISDGCGSGSGSR